MRSLAFLAVIVAAGALMLAGCGRSLDDAKVAASDLNTEQQAAARASRALTRPGSPGSRVLTLIHDVVDGAGPAALPAYDDRIPEDVGSADVLGGLRAAAGIINGGLPAVVDRRTTSAGELIVVRLLRTAGNDARYSFVLRREAGEWRIVYDSLLASGLEAYVQSLRSADPRKPPLEARRAAARALAALRLAALAERPRKSSGR